MNNQDVNNFNTISVPVKSTKSIQDWLTNSISESTCFFEIARKQLLDKKIAERILLFNDNLKEAHQAVNSPPLKDRLKPWSHIVPTSLYLYATLNNLFELIYLNHSQIADIKEIWETFRVDFACLRYEESPEIADKIHTFLSWVIAELEKVDKNRSYIQEEICILEGISTLIRNEPQLLDLTIGLIQDRELHDTKRPLIRTISTNAFKTTEMMYPFTPPD